MKSKLLRLVMFAVASLVLFSGCQSLRKSNPTQPPVSTPSTAPKVGSVGPQQPNQPPLVSSATAQVSSSRRLKWSNYSVFNNLIDVRSPVYSDASVLITNHRDEDLVIQISDRVVGIPDDSGELAVMVLPPGESFALRDYGLGASTVVRAVILKDNSSIQAGYLWVPVRWPQRGSRQIGGEMIWNIAKADPVELPNGPTPIKLPTPAGTSSSTGTTILTSQPGPAGSAPSGSAPAAPAGTRTTP